MAPNGVKAQSEKFKDLARKAECDEDEAAFEDKLKRIASSPSAKRTPAGKNTQKPKK